MIACVLIPDYLTTLERQATPQLAQPPILIRAGETPSYVYSLDQQCAAQGAYPGQPLRQALALCPDAIVLPASLPRYREALNALAESLSLFANTVEVAGLPRFGKPWRKRSGLPVETIQRYGVAYLDLGRLRASDGLTIAQQLQQHLMTHHQLTSQVGLAAGKFVAYAAAHHTQTAQPELVLPGQEAAYLVPRSVGLLPLEPEIARRLALFGVTTLGMFAALPRSAVVAQFGRSGRLLHRLASGEDPRRVVAWTPATEVQQRQVFDEPLSARYSHILTAVLSQLGQAVAERLRQANQTTRLLRLIVETSRGLALEQECRLRAPTDDPGHLTQVGSALLLQIVRDIDVTALRLRAGDLVTAEHKQLALFPDEQEQPHWQAGLDHLVARYGEVLFQPAVTDLRARLPEQRFELIPIEAA